MGSAVHQSAPSWNWCFRHLSLAGGVTWAPGPDKPFPDQVEYIEFRDSIMYLDGQICSVHNRLSVFILHFTVRVVGCFWCLAAVDELVRTASSPQNLWVLLIQQSASSWQNWRHRSPELTVWLTVCICLLEHCSVSSPAPFSRLEGFTSMMIFHPLAATGTSLHSTSGWRTLWWDSWSALPLQSLNLYQDPLITCACALGPLGKSRVLQLLHIFYVSFVSCFAVLASLQWELSNGNRSLWLWGEGTTCKRFARGMLNTLALR